MSFENAIWFMVGGYVQPIFVLSITAYRALEGRHCSKRDRLLAAIWTGFVWPLIMLQEKT